MVNPRQANLGRPRQAAWAVADGASALLPGRILCYSRRLLEDTSIAHECILILDFGSQYTQLIARRIRELSVYCEIWPYSSPMEKILARRPLGLVLSGGPDSVCREGSPRCDNRLFASRIPMLGICYGMQLMAQQLGGRVASAASREYGKRRFRIREKQSRLFQGINPHSQVWMSHGDEIHSLPHGFVPTGTTGATVSAMEHNQDQLFALQFHPEVSHTLQGKEILRNFVFDICGCRGDWTMRSFINESVRGIRKQTRGERVLCALSGGVDSAVAAAIVHRAVGDRLICVFVDNGLLRLNEFDEVLDTFRNKMKLQVVGVAAGQRFLRRLAKVADPERKRRIIGEEFIRVFEEQAALLGGIGFLVQGTLYPDAIESVSQKGPSATIKSHHNVGGLPERMPFKLIEPLRELFKDEVRALGGELGIDEHFVRRQPFPGPGLAVRILGPVTHARTLTLQQADAIVRQEIERARLADKLWQSFAVLLPIRSVGVMGDERTYQNVVALRAVTSQDGMTADWYPLPASVLERISTRIVNEVPGVNRVVFDITSKPPGTIEWE